ncbi:MAG: radical SAM protein [Cyanobacterium sp.]
MYFVIKLSKLCNLRCHYCYEYDELGNKERMSVTQLESFFRHVADYFAHQAPSTIPEFVFHGGEPLLLPHDYFRTFCDLQKKYLASKGIKYRNSLQTNLFQVGDRTLDLLQELDIALGVSFDVYGEQRVDIKGKDSRDNVMDNLQKLIDRRMSFGVINVLHAQNIDYVINTYHFFNQLGIDYRILPVSSMVDPSPRMQPLMVSHQQTVQAYQAIALEQFSTPSKIKIYPLRDYFLAAIRYLSDKKVAKFEPAKKEWVAIVNVNGDIYNYGEAYLSQGYMGNIFKQSLSEILNSPEHQQTVTMREKRMKTCRRCVFDQKCHQIPIAESQKSDRTYNQKGELECTIAKPMIQFMVQQIEQSPQAQLLLKSYGISPELATEYQF